MADLLVNRHIVEIIMTLSSLA